jgi:YD repeat-containing protein
MWSFSSTGLVSCVLVSLAASTAGAVPPAISSEQKTRVDRIFSELDRTTSPGCALGVIRDGVFVYERGYGMANLELGVPISPSTVFDIGSTSKQFTAMSVALLARRGRLSLDNPVRRWVSELPSWAETVTLRQLLHHTGGVRDYLELMGLAGQNFEDVSTDDDALSILARQKALNFEPGSEYLYSNSGFFLLSTVVRRASGVKLADFARENIFEPLGMRHTHFHDDHNAIVPNRATGYSPRESGGFQIDMSNFEQTGDGAVMTSIEDLLLWDRNFFDPKVGGPEVLRELQQTVKLTGGESIDYALGLRVSSYRGLQTVSHGGSWAGYRAELLRFPTERFSVACLCNFSRSGPSRLAKLVADELLGERLSEDRNKKPLPVPAKPAAVPVRQLESRTGVYRSARNGDTWILRVEDGKLKAASGGEEVPLLPEAADRFRASPPAALEFTFPPAGSAPRRLVVTEEGVKPQEYEWIEPARPTPADLAEYSGSYRCDELDATYRFEVSGGKLGLRIRGSRIRPLLATLRDEFEGDGRRIRFTRDADGRVSGFTLASGRVRNLVFVRESR